jgi:hypothetical protein
MEEKLISFETAKLAQEKGFNWLCYSWFFISKIDDFDKFPKYYRDKAIANYIEIDNKLVSHLIGGQHGKTINSKFKNSEDQPNVLACSTQSLLQKWLREVHNIDVQSICNYHYKLGKQYHLGIIFVNKDNKVDTIIIKETDKSLDTINRHYSSYEKALEEKLQEALKLI